MDEYKAWDKVEEIMSEVAEIDFVEKAVILKNDIYDDNVYLQGYIGRNFDQVELINNSTTISANQGRSGGVTNGSNRANNETGNELLWTSYTI